MKATLTLNKGRGSLTHNARTAKEKNQTWSDSLTGSNIWLCDRCKSSADLRKMYQEEFGSSLKKYNQAQISRGHSERQIRDYYYKIRDSKQEHLTYSFVYQIGELDHIAKGSEEEQRCIDALRDIGKGFEERNPSFKVAQSVIHCDEKGIAHLHLVFIPVSSGNKRGLEKKNSFVGALKDMGYKDKDNFKQWRAMEVKACNQIMLEHGIERIQSKNHENLIHDMEIYKKMKAEEAQMAQITPKKTILGRVTDKIELSTVQYETLLRTAKKGLKFDAIENQLAKDVQINAKKSAELENQKNDFLKQRKKSNYEIMQKEKELSTKEEQLADLEQNLEQREKDLTTEVVKLKQQNQAFENKIKDLQSENKELKANIDSLKGFVYHTIDYFKEKFHEYTDVIEQKLTQWFTDEEFRVIGQVGYEQDQYLADLDGTYDRIKQNNEFKLWCKSDEYHYVLTDTDNEPLLEFDSADVGLREFDDIDLDSAISLFEEKMDRNSEREEEFGMHM